MVQVHSKKRILTRYPKNPIITNAMMPVNSRGVYNSSAVKHDGKYIMILRSEGYNLRSSFWLAESPNGYDGWKIGEQVPLPDTPEYNRYADNQYDARITKVGDMFYVTFCAHGRAVRMGLFSSRDMKTFKWEGFMTGNGYRNTVLFPEKIDGLFTALERPNTAGEIWVTRSPDLVFWGRQDLILTTSDVPWAWSKVGPCGTPIRTPKGWLIIFHGVQTVGGEQMVYHTGVMLVDLLNPSKVVRVGNEPILTPEETYEMIGHVPNVVFASSHVVEDDGSVKVYYGGSDRYQCVADTTIDLLLEAALTR